MKHLTACLMLLAAGFIAPQASQAELIFSGTYHFKAFEHDIATCLQVLRRMQENDYSYKNLNASVKAQTMLMDDGKYYPSRCFGSGSREFCSKSGHRTYERIRITCYSDGDVRIRYERPRDDSVAEEDCMVKSGQPTICNSDSYRDKPESIRNDIARAIEEDKHRGTYRIYMNVTPEDARVKITNIQPRFENGMYLAPGRYGFEVSRPGYATRSFYIDHKAEQENFTVNLEPARAEKLETWIWAFPSEARVEMLATGETYTQGMSLMPGSYRMRVSAPGYETKTFTVTVDSEGVSSPSSLALKRDVASKQKQCEEVKQALVNDWHPDEKRKLTAEEMQEGKKNFNERCVPLGFATL